MHSGCLPNNLPLLILTLQELTFVVYLDPFDSGSEVIQISLLIPVAIFVPFVDTAVEHCDLHAAGEDVDVKGLVIVSSLPRTIYLQIIKEIPVQAIKRIISFYFIHFVDHSWLDRIEFFIVCVCSPMHRVK